MEFLVAPPVNMGEEGEFIDALGVMDAEGMEGMAIEMEDMEPEGMAMAMEDIELEGIDMDMDMLLIPSRILPTAKKLFTSVDGKEYVHYSTGLAPAADKVLVRNCSYAFSLSAILCMCL